MARNGKSPEKLSEASRHLLYEYEMLVFTAVVLTNRAPRIQAVKNALLESFGVHLRNTIDFFRDGKKQHKGDIRALDFKPSPPWASPKPGGLKKLQRRVDKEIAHLTYDRLKRTAEDKAWDPEAAVARVREWVQDFRSAVKPELLHPEWQAFDEEQFRKGALKDFGGEQVFPTAKATNSESGMPTVHVARSGSDE